MPDFLSPSTHTSLQRTTLQSRRHPPEGFVGKRTLKHIEQEGGDQGESKTIKKRNENFS